MIPEKGQIIRVYEDDIGFAMIGRFIKDESDSDNRKDGFGDMCSNTNLDPTCINETGYKNNTPICYEHSGCRHWVQATEAEITWFLRCEEYGYLDGPAPKSVRLVKLRGIKKLELK